jgi:hypothetical protein
MESPDTRYARSGSVSIAYQTVGDGPFDVVFIPAGSCHTSSWDGRHHRSTFSGRALFPTRV